MRLLEVTTAQLVAARAGDWVTVRTLMADRPQLDGPLPEELRDPFWTSHTELRERLAIRLVDLERKLRALTLMKSAVPAYRPVAIDRRE